MSYDLEIWSIIPTNGSTLPSSQEWREGPNGSRIHATDSWQIVISRADRVLLEDVPNEVANLLPGIECLTSINLEGDATEKAIALANRAAAALAKSSYGVIVDQQEGTYATPTGVKRFVPEVKRETFPIIQFSWWFLDSPLVTSRGRSQLIDFLETHLPEALPKRYGLYEPPQHLISETGKNHFLEFLDEHHHELVVWYTTRPVGDVYLGFPNPAGISKRGFRTNRLAISVEQSAVTQPGWRSALHHMWESVSQLVRPIYGDVRVLNGYSRGRGAMAIRRDTEQHPIRAWFFRGIPATLGGAAVLGGQYQDHWPSFRAAANFKDGLAFLQADDWLDTNGLAHKVGEVPKALRPLPQAASPQAQHFPEVWPFS